MNFVTHISQKKCENHLSYSTEGETLLEIAGKIGRAFCRSAESRKFS